MSKFWLKLRSQYKELNDDEVRSFLANFGFFDKDWHSTKNFVNQFNKKIINRDIVIEDHASNLMWHPSGSAEELLFEEAKQWIKDLRHNGYAGYTDWRLPTLEEAASLPDLKENKEGLHIDLLFSKDQIIIWTGDFLGKLQAWVVILDCGSVDRYNFVNRFHVRPVRPLGL